MSGPYTLRTIQSSGQSNNFSGPGNSLRERSSGSTTITEQPKKLSEQQAAPNMSQQSGFAANQRTSADGRLKSGTTNDQRNKNPESFERDGNVYTSNKATGRGKHALGNSGDVPKGPGNTYDKNTVSDDAQAFLGNMDAASVNAFFNGPPKEDRKKAHKKKKDRKESEDDEED